MRVLELARYNIPEKIIEFWISQVGEEEKYLDFKEKYREFGIVEFETP